MVVAWLITSSGVIPAFACVLAQLVSDHEIVVVQDAHGICIKLEHEDEASGDDHHALEGALLLLTAPCPDDDGGHHLDFCSSHLDSDLAKLGTVKALRLLSPITDRVDSASALFRSTAHLAFSRPHTGPPSASSVARLRTTVLVI